MRIRPVMFEWTDDEVMVPVARFKPLAVRQFAVGEQYALAPVENIPGASRGGFFAAVAEAWKNLPEDDARFPTREHLRKRALVHAGWAMHTQFVLDTPKDAMTMAQGLRRADEYAVIKVSGPCVDMWTAKSIAGGAITAEEWKDIKPRALDFCSALVGATRRELETHSRDGGGR